MAKKFEYISLVQDLFDKVNNEQAEEIMTLAKEMATLPLFNNIKTDNGEGLSELISKLFNGTLFLRKDDKGNVVKETIFKFDLRAEFGIAIETLQMAVPVVGNECIAHPHANYYRDQSLEEVLQKSIQFSIDNDCKVVIMKTMESYDRH